MLNYCLALNSIRASVGSSNGSSGSCVQGTLSQSQELPPADLHHSSALIVTYSLYNTSESPKLLLCTKEMASRLKHLICKPETTKLHKVNRRRPHCTELANNQATCAMVHKQTSMHAMIIQILKLIPTCLLVYLVVYFPSLS